MINASYCRTMAEYNEWMNARLYAVCDSMPDDLRKQDRGAFFGSIHSTLNHILYGDLAFMSRFTGDPDTVPALGVDLYAEFEVLWRERSKLDRRICLWAEVLREDWLKRELTYESKVDGVTRSVPRWVLVTHMFNHETHHRGQITTMLSQLGFDVGTTDIPFMPRFQKI